MPMNHDLPDRKHNRLPEYDYSLAGLYFVTFCTLHREHLLSEIKLNRVHLKKCGEICLEIWKSLPERFSTVTLDEFVIMPNHIHGIIMLDNSPDTETLSSVIGAFKSLVARKYYIWYRDEFGTDTGKIWQRSFHDHVIRNQRALDAIRKYIRLNPVNWEKDPENQ
ncbi:MAG: transposase [Anaerolineae bacterium]|jgi:REP element-mobilizing transposase RayT|nr:transposase [Anaerolineae bacterium]